MIKLVLALFLASIICSVQAEDYYRDENGDVYTIGTWGERRYKSQGHANRNPGKFRVDASNILSFGWSLFKHIDNNNFVFSPLSPQILLGCLAGATKNTSASYNELKSNIRYKDSRELEILVDTMLKEETARELKIASAFFVKKSAQGLKKSFYDESQQKTEVIELPKDHRDPYGFDRNDRYDRYRGYDRDRYDFDFDDYRGGSYRRRHYSLPPYPFPRPVKVFESDFRNTEKVNNEYQNWIKDATKGVIKNVNIDITPDTEMILTSAIYFKGQWLFDFNVTETIDFTTANGEVKQVEAMKIRKKYHAGRFDRKIKARWAAVPYNSTETMVIVLPHEGENIDDIIGQLDGSEMTEIIDDVSGYPSNSWLNVTLPKFDIKSKIDLKGPLQKMGIEKIFTPESELYLYEGGPALKVASAVQESALKVDEKGSIGASATAFSVVPLTIERDHFDSDFLINRPFIVCIIDRKYGVPYFIGKISDPTLS